MTGVPPTVTAASAMRQIVEWSESISLPLWQRDALRRLYSSCPLSMTDEDEVFSICKSLHSLLSDGETSPTPKSISVADVPASSRSSSAVTMVSISDVVHVNALADNQKVLFGSQGLTVVFGNNGSGKSGYARILKTVCRARSSEYILHNVYDKKPTVPASAKLLFSIGAAQQPVFKWKAGVPAAPALSLVSVLIPSAPQSTSMRRTRRHSHHSRFKSSKSLPISVGGSKPSFRASPRHSQDRSLLLSARSNAAAKRRQASFFTKSLGRLCMKMRFALPSCPLLMWLALKS